MKRENGFYWVKLSETPFKWTMAEYIAGSENAWLIPGNYGYLYEHDNVND